MFQPGSEPFQQLIAFGTGISDCGERGVVREDVEVTTSFFFGKDCGPAWNR